MKKTLRSLAADRAGNVLIMTAVAMIPIMGAIGSGIDIARAYLVKGKLQEAVDSAALAGRRAMTRDDIGTATDPVNQFMAFNFPAGMYGSKDLRTTVSKPEVGTVRVQATASVPTSVMGIFGIPKIDVGAVGEATQNFDNIDIVLVLDTTGSMLDPLGGQTKIDALQAAVKALYAELKTAQGQLQQQNLRMRFGIVPYAATVNIGKALYQRNPAYIQTSSVPYYHWAVERSWFFNSWQFGQRRYDLQNYVSGGTLGNINNNGTSYDRWAGCIEERQTTNRITANWGEAIPADAIDLDIDRIPDGTDATKWRPYIADLRYGDANEYCPAPATPLKAMTESEIAQRADELVAQGSTYHDVGMIWGTRLISGGGVFGSDNPSEYNGRPVRRYIIFMTDGTMSAPVSSGAYSQYYSGYGTEAYDRRVGGVDTGDNEARHTRRFLMACDLAKSRQVSVWTIAFGTGRVDSLDRCASNPDQTSVANDSAALIARFAQIGRNIGPLRISK